LVVGKRASRNAEVGLACGYDALRLVFADWLEDHGELERAEFIRVQIELAKLPNVDNRRPELEQRETGAADSWRGEEQPASASRQARIPKPGVRMEDSHSLV
jgi:uncharacterized protein (TIGR02996 family)